MTWLDLTCNTKWEHEYNGVENGEEELGGGDGWRGGYFAEESAYSVD